MPDVFENIERAPLPMLEMIAHVLELRASMPQQQEMQRTYLRDIEFPDGAQVLEVGCGTGAIARVVARWPGRRRPGRGPFALSRRPGACAQPRPTEPRLRGWGRTGPRREGRECRRRDHAHRADARARSRGDAGRGASGAASGRLAGCL